MNANNYSPGIPIDKCTDGLNADFPERCRTQIGLGGNFPPNFDIQEDETQMGSLLRNVRGDKGDQERKAYAQFKAETQQHQYSMRVTFYFEQLLYSHFIIKSNRS
jgi:hypothetical protein